MTHQITCSTELEPSEFFDAPMVPPDSQLALTISLSYAFIGAGMPPAQAEQDDAKKGFETFLDAVAGASFFAYEFNGDLTNPALTVHTGVASVDAVGAAPTGMRNRIMEWLEDRANGRWIADAPSADGTVGHRYLAAPHYLASAAEWDAPLPQQSGLTRVILTRFTNPPATAKNMVILPGFGLNAAPAVTVSNAVEVGGFVELEVAYDAGTPFPAVTALVRVLQPLVADPTSLVDEVSGYLKVRSGVAETHAALKRIRERSASLLWTFAQVTALELPRTDGEALITGFKRALWRGVSGLITLFDPLYIAITMNGSDREGPFVAALNALIDEKSPVDVSKKVTDEITKLVMTAFKASSAPERDALARLLTQAFNLGPLPEAASLGTSDRLLPALLRVYCDYTPQTIDTFNPLILRFSDDFDRQVQLELSELGRHLQTEDGIEAALIAIFKHLEIDSAWLATLTGITSNDADAVFSTFYQLLADSFNGADATRMAQGSMFEALLISAAKVAAGNGWLATDLDAALKGSEWFARRVGFPVVGAFEKLAENLPFVDLGYLDPALQTHLHNAGSGELDLAFASIHRELFPKTGVFRFIPDHAPRSLPVQIAVDQDTGDQDSFASRYNGVAVMVQRRYSNQAMGDWAYANLACLTRYGDDVPLPDLAIHPLQPIAIDGQRNLFIDYDGQPFSSNDFAETALAGQDEPEAGPSFYEIDSPASAQMAGHRKLPALAYGAGYRIAAHIVSKGGVLPRAIQKDPETPWLPRVDPVLTDAGVTGTAEVSYLRSTSLGRLTIIEPDGAKRRIGTGIDGVQPLGNDYPRLGLMAEAGRTAILDVLRNSDGTGAISLPLDDQTTTLALADLMWWKDAGTLKVSLLRDPGSHHDGADIAHWTYAVTGSFTGARASLTIKTDAAGHHATLEVDGHAVTSTSPPLVNFDALGGAGDRGSVWLRLQIAGDTAIVALSFADPVADGIGGHMASRPVADNLVMLAPQAAGEWKAELEKTVIAKIGFPRIGFVDFDRWLSNPDLLSRAAGSAPQSKIVNFRARLMTAYLGRMLSPDLAALVDSLPDLAVDRLLVELTPLDGLRDEPSRLAAAMAGASEEVMIKPLGQRAEIGASSSIHEELARLSQSHAATLKLVCGGSDLAITVDTSGGSHDATITVTVPQGIVARLTIRAMVPTELFHGATAVFDTRMIELAVGKRGAHYVFDGSGLTIEGMLGALAGKIDPRKPWLTLEKDWAEAANRIVAVRPAGAQRSYDLVAASHRVRAESSDFRWRWRQVGQIDVATQRWRFLGQPIYSWFDPKPVGGSRSAAVQLSPTAPELHKFEIEAFADRDDLDADTRTALVAPLPSDTLLQSFPWERPSATMFRHRMILRSRYTGALLRADDGEARSWKDQGISGAWLRAVILADRNRLQLTRPQLRALIPLTIAPTGSDGDNHPAPPILAVLDEPPFAHAGLADRIGSEIRTGFGFGADSPGESVQIKDARKEIGPDPRLSYRAMSAEGARAMTLQMEGPVGLTFDNATAPAPTFANSSIVLRPMSADGEAIRSSLEEHFLSVGLRRYIDHRWAVDHGPTPSDLAVTEPWWIECSQTLKLWLPEKNAGAGKELMLALDKDDHHWTISVNSSVIDPVSKTMVKVARASVYSAPGLAVLHQPLEEGRASLSIFALPPKRDGTDKDRGIAQGHTDLPLMLASVEWQVQSGQKILDFDGVHTAHPSSASPVTSMNWTRTGKSFNILHSSAIGDPDLVPLSTDKLEIRRENANALQVVKRGETTPRWLETTLGRHPHPLYVHRHLAILLTAAAPGRGRPMEVFQEALSVDGHSNTASKLQTARTWARVIEYELPAIPLAFNSTLAGFGKASFDMLAIRGDKYTMTGGPTRPVGIRLHFRPLGGNVANTTIDHLRFAISAIDTAGNSIANGELTITIPRPSGTALLLRWVKIELTQSAPKASAIFEGGGVVACVVTGNIAVNQLAIEAAERIDISPLAFQAKGVSFTHEFWGDLSLLTIPAGMESFSFDWLFTGTRLSAAEAVSPAQLRTVAEAEARIISISPAIPVLG